MPITFHPVPLPAAAARALNDVLRPGEIAWPVPGARRYFATTHGRIFSLLRGRATPLEGAAARGGYLQSWLRCDDGSIWRPQKNRAIALVFHGPPPIDAFGRPYDVHHLDGDNLNNAPENLRYEPAARHGLLSVRSRDGFVKLDESAVWIARCRTRLEPVSAVATSVAKATGASRKTVRMALVGKTWKCVPMPDDPVSVAELSEILCVSLDRAAELLVFASPSRRAA